MVYFRIIYIKAYIIGLKYWRIHIAITLIVKVIEHLTVVHKQYFS